MKDESTARACRYSSERAWLSETRLGEAGIARAVGGDGRVFSRSPTPCSVEKTSLQISVCTLMRSKDATLMEPPARTDCEGMSSSCQLRSKPASERMKLPASTKRTSSFLPIESGSSCCAGIDHQRTGRSNDQRGHAGQARGDGVGQRVAVERRGRGLGVGWRPWRRS